MVALIISIALAMGLAVARADDAAMRAQVSAATADAMASMRNDVLAVKITPDLTIGQFIDKTESRTELDQTLQRSQQIGGPRWIDEQTCQVKLELAGSRISYAIATIAAAHPKTSPLTPAEINQKLADLKYRTFTGTGTSISTTKIQDWHPVGAGDTWSGVPTEARVRTISAAREDAARQILQSVRPISIDSSHTAADLLAQPATEQRMMNWLIALPITHLQFRDDMNIELTVSAPSRELLDALLDAAKASGQTLQLDEAAVEKIRSEFDRRVVPVTGRAGVGSTPVAVTQPKRIDLPDQPPEWVFQSLDSEAIGERGASPLRSKTMAENKATDTLRARIGGLRINQNTTLDSAANLDPRINDAVNRSLLHARVYKVEYRADGSVLVRMSIDPRDLWQELHQIGD